MEDEGDEVKDRAGDIRYRVVDIFTDVIDDEYDEDANLDYEV